MILNTESTSSTIILLVRVAINTEAQFQCVVTENIHTSPTEGISSETLTPLEIPILKGSYISLNILVLQNPHPPGNSNPFFGGSMNIFLELHNAICVNLEDIVEIQQNHKTSCEKPDLKWIDSVGDTLNSCH